MVKGSRATMQLTAPSPEIAFAIASSMSQGECSIKAPFAKRTMLIRALNLHPAYLTG
jgi:hypothetical protein